MKTSSDFKHIPALLKESIFYLGVKEKKCGIWVDATLGLGGHSAEILKNAEVDSKVIGIDCDEESLNIAISNLKMFNNFIPVKENFKNIDVILKNLNINEIDGILYDLGVSSLHFEKPDRGFSFSRNDRLDMRFNKEAKITAFDIVNNYKEEEIAKILKYFGEERYYKKIANEIIKSRPVNTTGELLEIVKRVKRKKENINSATRVFQALRIAVNSELDNLKISLEKVIKFLKKGGRIVIISFHSLEDRIVKDFFKKESMDCICENKKLPCICEHKKSIKIITKKPVLPDENEIKENRKVRSAKLRAAEKII